MQPENNDQLQYRLIDAINTHLNLCDHTETPTVCAMLATESGRQDVLNLVLDEVVIGKKEIPAAIVSIENQFNPNVID